METRRLVPLYRKLAGLCVPAKVRLELTRKCNLECIHCKVVCHRKPRNEIGVEDLKSILPQLREAGAFEINLTGGEVFSRGDLIPVLSSIVDHGFLFSLTTNGTLISDAHVKFLDSVRDNLITIGISLYGANARVHDKVTGVPGSFDRTYSALMKLREKELPFAVFCMLMKPNAVKWRETEKFFKKNKFPYQFGGLLVAREDGCSGPLDLRIETSDLKSIPIHWESYLNPDPPSAAVSYTAATPLSEWCIAGRFTTILPNADVAVCSVIRNKVGNLREQSFREIWDNSELLKYFRSLRVGDLECSTCEYFPRCRPCIGLAFQETGSYTAKPSEYCRLTKCYLSKNKRPARQRLK